MVKKIDFTSTRPNSEPIKPKTINLQMLADRQDRTKRYLKQTVFDPETALDKIAKARITLVGAGGLNCPAAETLVRSGVGSQGCLTIIDGDNVEFSNLNRQKLFSEHQVGMNKAKAAKERLEEINSSVNVITRPMFFKSPWRYELDFKKADVIISGVDSDATRLEVTQKALRFGKPHIDGAVDVTVGRVLFFKNPRNDACFGCVTNKESLESIDERWGCLKLPTDKAPSIATVPSIVGEIIAWETIKTIIGIESSINNALYFNIMDWSFAIERFLKRKDCYCCSNIWWSN